MSLAVLLRDPDRVLLSTQAGEVHINTDPMNVKIGNPLAPLTQLLQPWRQFSRSRSSGRGRGATPHFSKSHQYKQ